MSSDLKKNVSKIYYKGEETINKILSKEEHIDKANGQFDKELEHVLTKADSRN